MRNKWSRCEEHRYTLNTLHKLNTKKKKKGQNGSNLRVGDQKMKHCLLTGRKSSSSACQRHQKWHFGGVLLLHLAQRHHARNTSLHTHTLRYNNCKLTQRTERKPQKAALLLWTSSNYEWHAKEGYKDLLQLSSRVHAACFSSIN